MLASDPTKRPSIYTILQHPIVCASGTVPTSLVLEPPKTPVVVPNYNHAIINDKLVCDYTPDAVNGGTAANTPSSSNQSPSQTFLTSGCGKLDFRE